MIVEQQSKNNAKKSKKKSNVIFTHKVIMEAAQVLAIEGLHISSQLSH